MRQLLFSLCFVAFAPHLQAAVAQAPTRTAALAKCLTKNGWAVYTAFTCTACRAQQRAFGEAYELIERVECHPYAPDSQYERCEDKGIVYTPTWIQEKGGVEIDRLEGFQYLESLASRAACPY